MSGEAHPKDWAAIETLFKRFYKPLRAYAFRFVSDEYLAEDIVQDVFFELWQRREEIRFEDASVKAYLFKAVYTHALNALNKRVVSVTPLDTVGEDDVLDTYVKSSVQSAEQPLLTSELEEAIRQYIKLLPPQCNKIFTLSRRYGLKNREIAEQLGISIKAVEKQISKALFGLKNYLGKNDLLLVFILFQLHLF